jgi:hypothetical protein
MVVSAILRISMSSAIRLVAGYTRFENGVMVRPLIKAGKSNEPQSYGSKFQHDWHLRMRKSDNRYLRYDWM